MTIPSKPSPCSTPSSKRRDAEACMPKKKYDLLHIRLSDKANILPKSDAKIKELVEYFWEEGQR